MLGPGDEPVIHDPTKDKKDAGKMDMMMPPKLTTKGYLLMVHLFRAEHLPPMDNDGKCDAFVVVNFGGITEKSKVVKGTRNPTFNQVVKLAT
mmetsp:Transcript_23787/g.11468  ORF Transcript_23787/g.11468 Transcript_23787/m.11468 type:complete len:92 (-) Transcript_23787:950-1225(-)